MRAALIGAGQIARQHLTCLEALPRRGNRRRLRSVPSRRGMCGRAAPRAGVVHRPRDDAAGSAPRRRPRDYASNLSLQAKPGRARSGRARHRREAHHRDLGRGRCADSTSVRGRTDARRRLQLSLQSRPSRDCSTHRVGRVRRRSARRGDDLSQHPWSRRFCRPQRATSRPHARRRRHRGLPAAPGITRAPLRRGPSAGARGVVEAPTVDLAVRRIPRTGRSRTGNRRTRIQLQRTARRVLASSVRRAYAGERRTCSRSE